MSLFEKIMFITYQNAYLRTEWKKKDSKLVRAWITRCSHHLKLTLWLNIECYIFQKTPLCHSHIIIKFLRNSNVCITAYHKWCQRKLINIFFVTQAKVEALERTTIHKHPSIRWRRSSYLILHSTKSHKWCTAWTLLMSIMQKTSELTALLCISTNFKPFFRCQHGMIQNCTGLVWVGWRALKSFVDEKRNAGEKIQF